MGIGTTEGTKETRTRTTNSSAKVAFILNKSLAKITLEYFAYKRDPHKWKISTNLMYKLNFFSCGISIHNNLYCIRLKLPLFKYADT